MMPDETISCFPAEHNNTTSDLRWQLIKISCSPRHDDALKIAAVFEACRLKHVRRMRVLRWAQTKGPHVVAILPLPSHH